MSGRDSDEPRNMGANMSTHSTESAHAPSTTLGDGGSIMSPTSTPPIHHMDIDEFSDDEFSDGEPHSSHSHPYTQDTTQQAPTSRHAPFFAGLRFQTAGKSNGILLPDEKILAFDDKSRGAGEQHGKAVVDAAGAVSGGSSVPPNSIRQSPPAGLQPGRGSQGSEGTCGEHDDLTALEATKTALEAENTALAAETRKLKCMLENRVTHCLSAMATIVRESFLTAQRFATLEANNKPEIPAPHHQFYFFYGALPDPATFRAAAEMLDSSRPPPPIYDARISGYHMVLVDKPFVHRSWLAAPDAPFLRTEKSYHKLVPGPFANVVCGKVCEIDDELALKLQPYGFAVPTSCEATLSEPGGGARKISAGIFMLDRVMDAQIQRQFMMGDENRDQYDRLLREKNARVKAAEEKAAEEKAAEEKAAEDKAAEEKAAKEEAAQDQASKEATAGRDENDRGWPGWNGLDGDW